MTLGCSGMSSLVKDDFLIGRDDFLGALFFGEVETVFLGIEVSDFFEVVFVLFFEVAQVFFTVVFFLDSAISEIK